MSSTIYHNPRCSTSRKTLDLLRDNGIQPEIVEYLKTPPSRAEIARLIADAGIDVRTAVRKRESLYTELNLAEASDDELLDAMAANPILIERPFVVTPKALGWPDRSNRYTKFCESASRSPVPHAGHDRGGVRDDAAGLLLDLEHTGHHHGEQPHHIGQAAADRRIPLRRRCYG